MATDVQSAGEANGQFGAKTFEGAYPLLLTVLQVTRRLQVNRNLVYRMISTGELKSIKVGGSRRIPSAALEEFIADRLGD